MSGFTANDDFVILLLHQFKYKLDGFKVNHLQKLTAENATEIKKLHVIAPPKIELLQLLFKTNKINNLQISKSIPFKTVISTDGIEVLKIDFQNPTYIVAFLTCFKCATTDSWVSKLEWGLKFSKNDNEDCAIRNWNNVIDIVGRISTFSDCCFDEGHCQLPKP